MNKLPKIGKRGWLGVILFAVGLTTFITARGEANELVKTTWTNEGADEVTFGQALAHSAGYNSWEDYLTERNRKSGCLFMFFGAGLAVWGLKKHGNKNSNDGKTQSNQAESPMNDVG